MLRQELQRDDEYNIYILRVVYFARKDLNFFSISQPEQHERKDALRLSLAKERETNATTENSLLLLLSLTYLKAAQKLTVTINRARNLPLADRKGRLGLSYSFLVANSITGVVV